jgi:antitoxin CptB
MRQSGLGFMIGSDIAIRKKRLAHRSRYRGFLESDIIFGRFADKLLDGLSAEQLDRYEALLEESDQDLFAWVTGRRPVPPEHDHDVLEMIRSVQSPPGRGA